MKPDVHKKKKNENYKKSHGINKDINDSKNKITDFKQSSQISNVNSQISYKNKQANSSKLEENILKNEFYDTESSLCKSYRKREIISNWSKYEISNEENDIKNSCSKRNLENILSSSAQTNYQYQYKQSEFDQIVNLIPDNSKIILKEFLTIDPQIITDFMLCIPLHKRINLDEDFLQPQLIRCFEETAVKQKDILSTRFITYDNQILVKKSHLDVSNFPQPLDIQLVTDPEGKIDEIGMSTNKFVNLKDHDYVEKKLDKEISFPRNLLTNSNNKLTNDMKLENNLEDNSISINKSDSNDINFLSTLNEQNEYSINYKIESQTNLCSNQLNIIDVDLNNSNLNEDLLQSNQSSYKNKHALIENKLKNSYSSNINNYENHLLKENESIKSFPTYYKGGKNVISKHTFLPNVSLTELENELDDLLNI